MAKMTNQEYGSVASFLYEVSSDESYSAGSYHKTTKLSKKLAAQLLRAWSESTSVNIAEYKTPDKAKKVAALIAAIADLIE